MIIVERFHSIQGEGPYLTPAFFVRLGGCNLRCKGFKSTRTLDGVEFVGCDTIHAVYPEFKKTWIDVPVEDLITEMLSKPIKQLIITGGEPTLHMRVVNQPLLQLINAAKEKGIEVFVETNGTKLVHPIFRELVRFSVSVKLYGCGENKDKRIVPVAINQFDERDYFKFVHNGLQRTTNEIKEIIKLNPKLDVYLMPLGDAIESQIKLLPKIIDICIENNWGISPRMHILAWNGEDKK